MTGTFFITKCTIHRFQFDLVERSSLFNAIAFITRDTKDNINAEAPPLCEGVRNSLFFYFHVAAAKGAPACKLQSACMHGLSVRVR